MKSLVVIMAVLLAWTSAPGHVINVPGEQPTIQQGLNAAAQGDTVLVQPGTYVSDYALLWPTVNGVKLLSAGDSSNTVISGTGNSNIIAIYGGGLIDTTTVIRGFRITHGGNVQYGGGIYMSQSSPIVEMCVIDSNNVTVDTGAGIYCTDSSRPVIRLSRISNNLYGGLAFENGSGGSVSGCRITDNGTISDGNGVNCSFSDPTLQDLYIAGHNTGVNSTSAGPLLAGCTIVHNNVGVVVSHGRTQVRGCSLSFNSSDGVWVRGQAFVPTTFSGCVISGNGRLGFFATNNDGHFELDSCVVVGNAEHGMCSQGASGGAGDTISNCVFADNGGSGITLWQQSPLITNCVLASNDSSGLRCQRGSAPLLRFCTICRNSTQNGGGIYCSEYSSPVVDSSTICENYATGSGDGVYTTASSWPTFSHCNILKNGWGIYNADNSQMLQAPNVWWGDSTGPWHPNYNPTGRGDSVSQFVYPLPYLTWGDTTGAPPIPPMGVDTPEVGGGSITLVWPPSTTGKLAGYKVYYDTDTSGFPYADTVDVGLDTTYTIHHTTDAAVTYYITVTCYDSLEKESWYSKEIAAAIPGSVEEEQLPHIPKVAALYPVSPNPFRATTVIRYALPRDEVVTLVVYDAAGRRVRTLARGLGRAGTHSVIWAGTDENGGLVSRGAYFCHLATSNGYSAIRKMLFR